MSQTNVDDIDNQKTRRYVIDAEHIANHPLKNKNEETQKAVFNNIDHLI